MQSILFPFQIVYNEEPFTLMYNPKSRLQELVSDVAVLKGVLEKNMFVWLNHKLVHFRDKELTIADVCEKYQSNIFIFKEYVARYDHNNFKAQVNVRGTNINISGLYSVIDEYLTREGKENSYSADIGKSKVSFNFKYSDLAKRLKDYLISIKEQLDDLRYLTIDLKVFDQALTLLESNASSKTLSLPKILSKHNMADSKPKNFIKKDFKIIYERDSEHYKRASTKGTLDVKPSNNSYNKIRLSSLRNAHNDISNSKSIISDISQILFLSKRSLVKKPPQFIALK